MEIFNNYEARDLREYLHVGGMLSERLLLRGLTFSKDLALVKGMLEPLENNFKMFIKLSICLFGSGFLSNIESASYIKGLSSTGNF